MAIASVVHPPGRIDAPTASAGNTAPIPLEAKSLLYASLLVLTWWKETAGRDR
jgi:hypothetical protein